MCGWRVAGLLRLVALTSAPLGAEREGAFCEPERADDGAEGEGVREEHGALRHCGTNVQAHASAVDMEMR